MIYTYITLVYWQAKCSYSYTLTWNFLWNCTTNRVTEMMSFSLHFRMANSNRIACFVGLPSRFFTNYRCISINQLIRHLFTQKFWKSCDYGSIVAIPPDSSCHLLREFYSMCGLAAGSFYGWWHHTQPLYSSVMPMWDACFVNLVRTKMRNRFHSKTMGAILKVKCGVAKAGGCIKFNSIQVFKNINHLILILSCCKRKG